jgi:hypothetical protein
MIRTMATVFEKLDLKDQREFLVENAPRSLCLRSQA